MCDGAKIKWCGVFHLCLSVHTPTHLPTYFLTPTHTLTHSHAPTFPHTLTHTHTHTHTHKLVYVWPQAVVRSSSVGYELSRGQG